MLPIVIVEEWGYHQPEALDKKRSLQKISKLKRTM